MNDCDLLLRGGMVIDGSGAPGYQADVAVSGDRIAAIGDGWRGAREIDARGLVVAPGFIDQHTHSDLMLLADPHHAPKVRQGITTEVIGHDGLSYAPVTAESLRYMVETFAPINGAPELDYAWRSVAEFLARFDRRAAVNVAYLLPHGTIRATVIGRDDRPASEAELARMSALVTEGMSDGAVGFSTGLTYAPCSYGDTDELVALCSAAARQGGVFMPHLRSYGTEVVAAHDEALDIARRSGIALHLTHHQCVFPCNRDRHEWYTQVIDEARAAGLDVTCDSYPYIAGSTFLIGYFPSWAQGRGRAAVVELLRDPATSERLRQAVEVDGCDGGHGVPTDWSRVQLGSVGDAAWRHALGRRVDALAAERGLPTWELVRRLLIDCAGDVNVIHFGGHEHAVRQIMRHETHMVGSDGILVGENPHPRVYGTFPRYLGHYVREERVLGWEQCIHQMTGAAAARLRLRERGLVRAGYAADLVVFDPATVGSPATFEAPRQYPTGIPYVICNGVPTVVEGEVTGALPGRAVGPSGDLTACRG